MLYHPDSLIPEVGDYYRITIYVCASLIVNRTSQMHVPGSFFRQPFYWLDVLRPYGRSYVLSDVVDLRSGNATDPKILLIFTTSLAHVAGPQHRANAL